MGEDNEIVGATLLATVQSATEAVAPAADPERSAVSDLEAEVGTSVLHQSHPKRVIPTLVLDLLVPRNCYCHPLERVKTGANIRSVIVIVGLLRLSALLS